MEKIPNKGKNLIIGVDGQKYARIPVKTELVNFGDDLISVIKKYITSEFHEKDYLVISEKIVSVCQNNFRHISTVKVGSLAKLIVKGVKKYPNDIGFSDRKDYLVISEKIVSVCQNNFRHISTVKVGSLAKLIVKGVKKYPNDIGF